MLDNFFKHIDIDPKNAHVLDGNAKNLVAECEEHEKKIAAAGGIELFVGGLKVFHSQNMENVNILCVGIGPDGHIAFNEPGSSLVSRTRVKTLAQDTIIANARCSSGHKMHYNVDI